VENSVKNHSKPAALPQRLRDLSFPPAAIAGAFASFISAIASERAEARSKFSEGGSLAKTGLSGSQHTPRLPDFKLKYALTLTLGTTESKFQFHRSLAGIAVDPADRIYVLCDGQAQIFSSDGNLLRKWQAPDNARCLAVDNEDRIYFGIAGRVEIFNSAGTSIGAFFAGDSGQAAEITAIKVSNGKIFIADAASRLIRLYDPNGKQLGVIGTHGKSRGFMLPNRALDFGVDAGGIVFAADSGRHRVSSWNREGSPIGYFGKFGISHPQDFTGCCNPVNIAVAPDGTIATAEKAMARIKIFDPERNMIALIGSEHFDPKCTHLHLAFDSKGRILAADPVRLEVKIFSARNQPGEGERL
jgi:hypothetical protein